MIISSNTDLVLPNLFVQLTINNVKLTRRMTHITNLATFDFLGLFIGILFSAAMSDDATRCRQTAASACEPANASAR